MLKILLLFVPMISFATPASASNWWWVSSTGSGSNEQVTFVDQESTRPVRQGSVEAWTLLVRETADADGERKAKTLQRYDCQERTITALSRISIANNDRVLRSTTWSTYQQEALHVVPDSVGEALWQFICKGPDDTDFDLKGSSPEAFAAEFFRM